MSVVSCLLFSSWPWLCILTISLGSLELYKARQLRNGRRDCTMRPCGLAANSNYVSDDTARPRRGWGTTFERKLPPAPDTDRPQDWMIWVGTEHWAELSLRQSPFAISAVCSTHLKSFMTFEVFIRHCVVQQEKTIASRSGKEALQGAGHQYHAVNARSYCTSFTVNKQLCSSRSTRRHPVYPDYIKVTWSVVPSQDEDVENCLR